MNILRIYPFINEGKGGMENHIRSLSEEQIKLGHTVTLLYSQGKPVSNNDIRIFEKWPYKKIKPQSLSFLFFHLRAIVLLLTKRLKYDVIHIHGDWSSLIFAPIYRFVVKAHHIAFSFHGQVKNIFVHDKLLPKFISSVNVMFVNGYDAYEIYHTKGNVVFRPSGVDELFFEKSSITQFHLTEIHIISVGSLIPTKNMSLILDIAAQLPHISFTIVGRGPESEQLELKAKKLKLKNVLFIGFIKKSDLKPLLEKNDIFLLCSLEEGTPTVILEAMAVGLPIVTSNAGGVSSIIKDFHNGFVIQEFTDTMKYISAINKLISNEVLLKEIKMINKNEALAYSWKNTAQMITTHYCNS